MEGGRQRGMEVADGSYCVLTIKGAQSGSFHTLVGISNNLGAVTSLLLPILLQLPASFCALCSTTIGVTLPINETNQTHPEHNSKTTEEEQER